MVGPPWEGAGEGEGEQNRFPKILILRRFAAKLFLVSRMRSDGQKWSVNAFLHRKLSSTFVLVQAGCVILPLACILSYVGRVGRVGGGDWFGSDPLSKRVLHFRTDPKSKSIFVSRTPFKININ